MNPWNSVSIFGKINLLSTHWLSAMVQRNSVPALGDKKRRIRKEEKKPRRVLQTSIKSQFLSICQLLAIYTPPKCSKNDLTAPRTTHG